MRASLSQEVNHDIALIIQSTFKTQLTPNATNAQTKLIFASKLIVKSYLILLYAPSSKQHMAL